MLNQFLTLRNLTIESVIMVMSKSDEETLHTNLGMMFPTLMLRKSMTTGAVTQ